MNRKDPTFVERFDLKKDIEYRHVIDKLKLQSNYEIISKTDIVS